MWLGKWMHGLGAIGVELLAVMVVGWVLSVVHPAQDVSLSTTAQLSGQSAAADSAGLVSRQEGTANRNDYVNDQLHGSADGLFRRIAGHVNNLFAIDDET